MKASNSCKFQVQTSDIFPEPCNRKAPRLLVVTSHAEKNVLLCHRSVRNKIRCKMNTTQDVHMTRIEMTLRGEL
jgi:hypothetical protein